MFRLFRSRSETLKQTEKVFFGFAKQTENNRNRLSFGLFRLKPKKFDCFEDTLAEKHGNSAVKVAEGKDLVAVESSEESVVCGKVAVKA